jgi:hypothetical protein
MPPRPSTSSISYLPIRVTSPSGVFPRESTISSRLSAPASKQSYLRRHRFTYACSTDSGRILKLSDADTSGHERVPPNCSSASGSDSAGTTRRRRPGRSSFSRSLALWYILPGNSSTFLRTAAISSFARRVLQSLVMNSAGSVVVPELLNSQRVLRLHVLQQHVSVQCSSRVMGTRSDRCSLSESPMRNCKLNHAADVDDSACDMRKAG